MPVCLLLHYFAMAVQRLPFVCSFAFFWQNGNRTEKFMRIFGIRDSQHDKCNEIPIYLDFFWKQIAKEKKNNAFSLKLIKNRI